MLHMAFVRSPFAHARITSVDVSAARSMPGVIAAFSGADFGGQGSLPCAWPVTPDIVIPHHPPMATEEVREGLEGNLCRCTGYQNIVRAVMRAASASQGASS